MKLLSNLLFTDIDFCNPKVIQSLYMNFNLPEPTEKNMPFVNSHSFLR